MITIDCGRQLHGDLNARIAQLTDLTRDLMLIANGDIPIPNIEAAPCLDQVVLAKRAMPCLIGHLDKATDYSRVFRTSELMVADWETGWVRTQGRFYRIRRVLDRNTK